MIDAPLWRSDQWTGYAASVRDEQLAEAVPVLLRRPGPLAAPAAGIKDRESNPQSSSSSSSSCASASPVRPSPPGFTFAVAPAMTAIATASAAETTTVATSPMQSPRGAAAASSGSPLKSPPGTGGGSRYASSAGASPRAHAAASTTPAAATAQASGPPQAVVPIASLPLQAWLAETGAAAGVVEGPHACFELPGMLGAAGRRYIQVVDLQPAHMPPIALADDHPTAAQHASQSGGGGGGGGADGADGADGATSPDGGGTFRPSHPKGAWGGRSADQVIDEMHEAEATQWLGTLQATMARLERQADALEIELGGVANAADVVHADFAQRRMGASAALIDHLDVQAEKLLHGRQKDLSSLRTLQEQLRTRGAPVSAPALASPPRLVALSASPRASGVATRSGVRGGGGAFGGGASATTGPAGGRGGSSSRGGRGSSSSSSNMGRGKGHGQGGGQARRPAEAFRRSPPPPPAGDGAAGSDGSVAAPPIEAEAPTTAQPTVSPALPAERHVESRVGAGAGAGSGTGARATAARSGGKGSGSRSGGRGAGGRGSGSRRGGASSEARPSSARPSAPVTSASQSLRTLAKEKLRQAELDRRFAKKLAKAEATLQRLLEPHGLAQHATSFPAEDPVMLSAPELGLLLPADGVSTEAGGNDGDCAGDSSAAFASAPTAGAQSPRSSVLGATAPIAAPAEPALEGSALEGRRQQVAVIMAAESSLLGVMSTAP